MDETHVATWDKPIVAFFCDGGLIGSNPSPVGGTWAFCGVAADGDHVREVSAYLLPVTSTCPGNPRVNSTEVTNADTEFYAALRALEEMPAGWSGGLASDSQTTLDRLEKIRAGERITAFRLVWESRARSAFRRLGTIKLVHLAGHPNLQEQADQQKVKKDGTVVRVNRHQVWADSECRRLAQTFDEHMDGFRQIGLLPDASAA